MLLLGLGFMASGCDSPTGGNTGPPTVITETLPWGVAQLPYRIHLQAFGGTWPYTWSLGQGSDPLPAGLQLSPGGVVSGTPLERGEAELTFVATAGDGQSDERALTLRVTPCDLSDISGAPRDRAEVEIDSPSPLPPWMVDPADLEAELSRLDGQALAMFKEPYALRIRDTHTGNRAVVTAVSREAIEDGTCVLKDSGAVVHVFLGLSGAVSATLQPGLATELWDHPLINVIEPNFPVVNP